MDYNKQQPNNKLQLIRNPLEILYDTIKLNLFSSYFSWRKSDIFSLFRITMMVIYCFLLELLLEQAWPPSYPIGNIWMNRYEYICGTGGTWLYEKDNFIILFVNNVFGVDI